VPWTLSRSNRNKARELEFDLIYVNCDNNLENLRRPDQTWKVRVTEDTSSSGSCSTCSMCRSDMMNNTGLAFDDLKDAIGELGERYPKFGEDDLFVMWFCGPMSLTGMKLRQTRLRGVHATRVLTPCWLMMQHEGVVERLPEPDNNLENPRPHEQMWKMRMIEEEFQRLMFDVNDV
jgi:hypothetical protein